jgi:integrase/recombinase XerD
MAVIGFLYGSGSRIGEMVGMTMDKREYSDREGVREPVAVRVVGKGDKERRVPLSPTARRALYQWLKHHRLEDLQCHSELTLQTQCETLYLQSVI